jgi:hypothetical protein
MKKILILVFLSFFSVAHGHVISEIGTAVLASPLLSATKIIETSVVASLRAVKSTQVAIQARGVAGKEQLKDELVALDEAMVNGHVKSIDDVTQPGLKELFLEISLDEQKLYEIDSLIPNKNASLVQKVATAVALILLAE